MFAGMRKTKVRARSDPSTYDSADSYVNEFAKRERFREETETETVEQWQLVGLDSNVCVPTSRNTLAEYSSGSLVQQAI